MRRQLLRLVMLALPALAHGAMPSNDESADRTLIVLAAPTAADRYYCPLRQDILDFLVVFAKSIRSRDNVVILGDRKTLRALARKLPADLLLEAPMRDIWLRDFTPVMPGNPVLFRYAAAAQGGRQANADWVQDGFLRFARRHGLAFRRAPWILDGGNVVDNGTDKAIVTDRFLADNGLDPLQAVALLRECLGVRQAAILPAHPDDRLGHADGMAAFIGINTVAISRYAGESTQPVRQALADAFPGVKVVELDTEMAGDAYDPEYGSARGIHVNATVTGHFIYLPVFGLPTDASALEKIRRATDKEVVPVAAGRIARLGGSVRCLSWQVQGDNARKLIEAARRR